jgi:ATP-dependent DNA helicase PIF1
MNGPADESERIRLSTAPFIMPTRADVTEHNSKELESLNRQGHLPCRINAIHSNKGARKITADNMGGLKPVLFLARNCRIMITSNLWVEMGIVDGTMGYVRHIIFAENHLPPSMPIAVIVEFDSQYEGPSLPNKMAFIVVEPKTISFSGYERTQLPLRLCYAITIHKVQSKTLDIGRVDLGNSEWTPALTYVALSRFRTLNGIFLKRADWERFKNIKLPDARKSHDILTKLLIQNTIEDFNFNYI